MIKLDKYFWGELAKILPIALFFIFNATIMVALTYAFGIQGFFIGCILVGFNFLIVAANDLAKQERNHHDR